MSDIDVVIIDGPRRRELKKGMYKNLIVINGRRIPHYIMNFRHNQSINRYEYFVKFKGMSIEHSEWLTSDQIEDKRLIENYNKKFSRFDNGKGE